MRATPNLLRAFRHRNFALFFSGQIISLIGTWMQSVAQAWLVYRLTGSATMLGIVGFATMIPSFLFASFGGLLADRVSRRRILLWTQILSMTLAFILAVLTLSGMIQVWHILLLATLLGLVNAFDVPARQSFVVEMVAREHLPNAIALNSSMFNGARMIGPAVAGVIVATLGEGWCFLINAISYVAVIAGLLMMKMPPGSPRTGEIDESILSRLAGGWRFASRTRPIRALLLLLGLVSLVGMPYTTLMPIFADRILHGGPQALGILLGSAGLGAFGGSIVLATRRDVRGLGRWVARAAVAFGAFLIVFAFSRIFWLSAAILVAVGASMIVQMAASNTLIQVMVPDALRGRVMALYSMMFLGMAPFGALFAGWLAERLTAPVTLGIGGVMAILGGAFFMSQLPKMRVEARRLIIQNEMPGGPAAEKVVVKKA
ncbi:MAG: MFS transporter [Acidobacteria bacterium]|nr:MFS transporter [Acidobacteriota bacterium]